MQQQHALPIKASAKGLSARALSLAFGVRHKVTPLLNCFFPLSLPKPGSAEITDGRDTRTTPEGFAGLDLGQFTAP